MNPDGTLRLAQGQVGRNARIALAGSTCDVRTQQEPARCRPVDGTRRTGDCRERRIHDRLYDQRMAAGQVEDPFRSAYARQFEFGLEGGSERALERTAIRVEVGHDHAVNAAWCQRQAPAEPRDHRLSLGLRIQCPMAEAGASLGGRLESFNRAAGRRQRDKQGFLSRRQPAETGEQYRWANRRQCIGFDQEACEVARVAALRFAQLFLDRSCPAEEGLLVARQGPAGHGRKVRAMRPESQPARSRAGREVRRVQEPGSIACHAAAPYPAQGDWRQGRGEFRAICGSLKPLQRKPCVERQDLSGGPDLAPRCYLRAIVQAPQDPGLAQVRRQQEAAGLEVGDTTRVRVHLAGPLAPDGA